MPLESKFTDGTARIDGDKTKIYINTDTVGTTSELVGTVFEEFSHILGSIAGRADGKVAENTKEKGQESLGKPTNDYFQDKYSKDSKPIKLTPEGDYTFAGGINVGDKEVINPRLLYETIIPRDEKESVEELFYKLYGEKYKIDWKKYYAEYHYQDFLDTQEKLDYRKKINYYYLQAAKNIVSLEQFSQGKFEEVKPKESVFHNYDATEKNILMGDKANRKFVEYDTGREVVLTHDLKKIVNDPHNIGTTNIYTYELDIKKIVNMPEELRDKRRHFIDILDFLDYGTGINDNSTYGQRLNILSLGSLTSYQYEGISKWASKDENNKIEKIGYSEIIKYNFDKLIEKYKSPNRKEEF